MSATKTVKKHPTTLYWLSMTSGRRIAFVYAKSFNLAKAAFKQLIGAEQLPAGQRVEFVGRSQVPKTCKLNVAKRFA